MSFSTPVHGSLELYTTTESFIIQAKLSPQGGKDQLHFSRRTGAVTYNNSLKNPLDPKDVGEATPIDGILGKVPLATMDVLVLISSSSTPQTLLSAKIYNAETYKLLPLSLSTQFRDPRDEYLFSLVQTGLNACQGRLWFSYERDLTNTLDRSFKKGGTNRSKMLWEGTEERFFFNKAMVKELVGLEGEAGRFVLPVIFGTVMIRPAIINSKRFEFVLISRRSRYRVGTRYFTRGINTDGHAANSNETEQVLVFGEGHADEFQLFSYVQTRGSVPVYWAQVNNLRYQPDLQVMDKPETAAALKSHIDDQTALYGDVYLINLVNQKGYEKPVKEAFEHAMRRLGDKRAHYEYFDFHAECKGMRFDRVQGLIDRLKEPLRDQGFFQLSAKQDPVHPVKLQKAIVRTNCMDSLDRTNVVQSALAKHVLNEQLRVAGVLQAGQSVEQFEDFMSIFRNLWADHADTISIPYSGTGALKTDFTRTGTRTTQGAVQDGINSVMRYVKNNFYDGRRQDGYDLLTGAFDPRDEGNRPIMDNLLKDDLSLTERAMPYVFFYGLLMLLSAVVLPRQSNVPMILFFIPWLAVASFALMYMLQNGINYVDWPRLNRPTEVMAWQGAGFRTVRKGRGGDVLGFKGIARQENRKTV